MPRFSIRQLLIATAFIAVGCFGLLNATPLIAAASLTAVTMILCTAVLLSIYWDAERRAFWIGFVILGWVYLLLCFGGFLSATGFDWRGNFTGSLLRCFTIALTQAKPHSRWSSLALCRALLHQ